MHILGQAEVTVLQYREQQQTWRYTRLLAIQKKWGHVSVNLDFGRLAKRKTRKFWSRIAPTVLRLREKKISNNFQQFTRIPKGGKQFSLNWIRHNFHVLHLLSQAKLSVLIPLGNPTKRPSQKKLILSSVLFSSILSPTSHTGLQRTVLGWQLEIALYSMCVCVCVHVLQPSQRAKLRICCKNILSKEIMRGSLAN